MLKKQLMDDNLFQMRILGDSYLSLNELINNVKIKVNTKNNDLARFQHCTHLAKAHIKWCLNKNKLLKDSVPLNTNILTGNGILWNGTES